MLGFTAKHDVKGTTSAIAEDSHRLICSERNNIRPKPLIMINHTHGLEPSRRVTSTVITPSTTEGKHELYGKIKLRPTKIETKLRPFLDEFCKVSNKVQ